MSFLRALSMLILIAVLVTSGIVFAELTGDATTGSYQLSVFSCQLSVTKNLLTEY